MLSNLGIITIILTLLISFWLVYNSTILLRSDNSLISKKIINLSSLQLFFSILCFLLLVYGYISSNFSLINVFQNSHSSKPLFFKIAGTWGNHEGSLLLWINILIIFSYFFLIKGKNYNNNFRLVTLIIQNFLIIGFLLFLLATSNPFAPLYPIPNEGLGLNPILQDPALAIHPPLLYIGFVGSSIYFSAAIASLLTNFKGKEFAHSIKSWVLISWIFQSLGIIVGSIWAYYELGWGGFWFWDPVENISIMPWFCLTALIHTVLVLEKRQSLKNWTIVLSISTFTLSMCGTFLVRSGILNSIHTFANDPSRGIFILTFLFVLIILSLIIFFIYFDKENTNLVKNFWLSKETAILINNWFMMYFLSVVLIGTIYPIFLEVLTNDKISIGPPFYQKLIVPFLIPFFIFMAFGPKIKWIKDSLKKFKLNQIFLFIVSLIIAILIIEISERKYLFSTILISLSMFLFFNCLKDFLDKKSQYSQKVSHLAFSLLILSILLNGIFSKEFTSNMKVGEELEFSGKKIKFKSVKINLKENFNSIEGIFEITDVNNKVSIFYPEIRIFNQPKISTSEADIKVNIFTDNFLVFNLLKDDETFNVRYQYKPFMIWIWISSIALALGGLLSLVRK